MMRTAAVVAVVALLGGCSISLGGEGGDDVDDPAAAMQEAGLTLPSGASDARVESRDMPDRKAAYAVTFTAPRAEAEALCDQLGGVGFASRVPGTHADLIGDLPVEDGARQCEMNGDVGGLWFRYALIEPGDPATVHVSLQHMSR